MKRKLALLLAAVMLLTMLPMNVFAASEVRLTKQPTSVPDKTLVPETFWLGDVGLAPGPMGTGVTNDDVKYIVDGTDLVVTLKDTVKAGDSFKIQLENAVWFFRGGDWPVASDSAFALATNNYEVDTKIYGWAGWSTGSTQKWIPGDSTYMAKPSLEDTYDSRWGIWGYNTGQNPSASKATAGTYFRFGDTAFGHENAGSAIGLYRVVIGGVPYYRTFTVADAYLQSKGTPINSRHDVNKKLFEVPYSLEVETSTDTIATIRILNSQTVAANGTLPTQSAYIEGATRVLTSVGNMYSYTQYGEGCEIRIPLVSRTTKEADIRANIIENNNMTSISTGKFLYGIASAQATNTTVPDPETGRDVIAVPKIVIRESRVNSIKDGQFQVSAPSGFEFNNPNALDSNSNRIVRLGVESGLAWVDTGLSGYGWAGVPSGIIGDQSGYTIAYRDAGTRDEDRSIIVVTLYGIQSSTTLAGAVFIDGLELLADDGAAWGDIMLSIRSIDDYTRGGTVMKSGVTTQTFKGGVHQDWTISLTTEGTIPELVNGRYAKFDMSKAEDAIHKTAKVVFAENTVDAWWSARQTVFTLPKGVKFRKVDITDAENVDASTPLVGTYYNNNTKKGSVIINGNTMTWNNIKLKANSKAKIKFDVWVSIESGYVGDVTINVSGSAIPVQTAENSAVPTAKIATQISPITLTTKTTDIKIGYQFQQTADIVITETKAGVLQKNKSVELTLSDTVSSDMYFISDKAKPTKVEVTAGDIKIKDVDVSTGYIAFGIDVPSSKASTVTISNVAVKIDRAVPVTNKIPYEVIAGGNAIAANYSKGGWLKYSEESYYTASGLIIIGYNPDGTPIYGALAMDLPTTTNRDYGGNLDTFGTKGIKKDYISVISSATDNTSVLTQEVRVTIGESYYTVNGVPYEMPVAAYISTASNSTMVPLRFVANAFGITDDQIIWDDSNHTVTILLPQRVVQFTIGEAYMKVNGVEVALLSPDQLPVAAEITNDRSFVPFRALGDAFGIPVSWDEATQTAIYNEGASVTAPAAATTPAAAPAAPAEPTPPAPPAA